jgi:SAM-dependent methyltransferase
MDAALSDTVLWHDIECGGYDADLALWRELAGAARAVLEIGAGTGRVTLDLARREHPVTALDCDGELLAALRERAADLPVDTVTADARDFALGRRFGLVLAPMQTVQLLAGAHADFVRCAADHLAPGGVLAVALANPPAYEGDVQPLPDMRERDGWVWCSQPVAIRSSRDGMVIERVRETVSPAGERTIERDEIVLARTTADDVEAAGRTCGLTPLERRAIPETEDYVGSEVAVLRA